MQRIFNKDFDIVKLNIINNNYMKKITFLLKLKAYIQIAQMWQNFFLLFFQLL
jgi:hypothetical protein